MKNVIYYIIHIEIMLKNKKILTIFLAVVIVIAIGFGIVVATGGFSGMQPNIPDEGGLVGYWSLNESDLNNATIFQDLSGNGNNGTSANTPSFVSDQNGVPNQAMDFNGSSDVITLGTEEDLGTTNTISFWMNNANTTQQVMIGTTSVSESTIYSWDDTDRIHYRVYSTGGAEKETEEWDAVIEHNIWNHFVFVRSAGTVTLYINGVNEGSQTITQSGYSTLVGKVGNYGGANSYAVDGYLSDVAIYNKALSQAEISALYSASRTTAKVKIDTTNPNKYSVGSLQKKLILDMPLMTKYTKSATILSDKTPYGNDGTNHGADIQTNYTDFGGDNQYISITNSDILYFGVAGENPDIPFSISAWINADSIGNFVIINKGRVGTNNEYVLGTDASEKLYIRITDETNRGQFTITSQNALNNTIWYHIVGTYDGSGSSEGLNLYQNASLISIDVSSSGSYSHMRNLGADIYIGFDNGSDYSDGKMANIKMWNRVLTLTEIQLLYDKEKSGY